MANKNKKGAIPVAPKTTKQENDTKTQTNKNADKIEVIDVAKFKTITQTKAVGLDDNHRVDILMGLKSYFHDDKTATEKFGQGPVDTINKLTAIGFATAFVQEAFYGDNKWAATMRTAQLESLKEVAPMIGFTIDTKLLPAPDKNGNIVVPAKAIKVSTDTKKALEKEKKTLSSKPITDPTKITTEDQLKVSLNFMLSDSSVKRPYDKMVRATEFLRSYQIIQAGDDKTAVTTITKKSISDLLEEVRKLVGECPFATVGISHFITEKFYSFKNPIFSFCLLRNASRNKENDTLPVDDTTIAAIVRTMVNWVNEPKIEYYKKELVKAKELAKTHKNAQDHVNDIQHNVDYTTTAAETITNCPTEFADNLLTDMNSEDTNTARAAKMTVSMILKSYYPEIESIDAVGDKKDALLHDIQQRAGIITNYFRDPLSQDIRYSDANFIYTAESPTEETSKN